MGVLTRGGPLSLVVLCALLGTTPGAGAEVVDFSEELWDLRNAEVFEHLGRTVLAGIAYMKDVEFQNGVIEVDVAVSGQRSYPGVMFRMKSERDHEKIYLRPHRASIYPDAVQYTPSFNGVSGWQLYNGDGYTAGVDLPTDEWIHVRLEVSGTQARIYVGDVEEPKLVVQNLKHGLGSGTVGLSGPRDGTAYFSNFSYREDNSLTFDPPPIADTPPGTFTNWQISQSFRLGQLDIEEYPLAQAIGDIEWELVESEPIGLVDLARHRERSGREPDCVLARNIISSETDKIMELRFGYSDAISIFLNGQLVFFGNSAYRQRDPSFLGIVGLNDAVYLPLGKGDNELLLIVIESFGGWGFVCRDGRAVFQHESIAKVAETDDVFLSPESVVYDPVRDILYVSNYDAYGRAMPMGGQFISRVSLEGEVVKRVWAEGLRMPTGMAIWENSLFVVERIGIAEVNLDSGQMWTRYEIENPVFPNDIAIDKDGLIYVSDSGADVIYRFDGTEFVEWLAGDEVDDPNGLFIDEDELLFGNNGDDKLKSVDIATKEVRTIARFTPGIIDGIRVDENGDYIVSQWEGRVYRVSPSGVVEKLIDTSTAGVNVADFEYLAEKNLLITPTFADDRIVSYRLSK